MDHTYCFIRRVHPLGERRRLMWGLFVWIAAVLCVVFGRHGCNLRSVQGDKKTTLSQLCVLEIKSTLGQLIKSHALKLQHMYVKYR